MTSTTTIVDWTDFIPIEYRKYIADEIGDKLEYVWSWLGEIFVLPPIYTYRRIDVKYCRFKPKTRYRKMFCGHQFKIGGHKE